MEREKQNNEREKGVACVYVYLREKEITREGERWRKREKKDDSNR